MTNAAYVEAEEEREDTLVEAQIDGLLSGDGASEDHQDVLAFLRKAGLRQSIADRVHKAIVNAEVPNLRRPSKTDPAATTTGPLSDVTEWRHKLGSAALEAKAAVGTKYARQVVNLVSEKLADVASEDVLDLAGMFRLLKKAGYPALVKRGTYGIDVTEEAEERKSTLMQTVYKMSPHTAPATPVVVNSPEDPYPTSIGLLERARDIQVQRAKDYDQPGGERSMANTVAAFNIITGRDLSESEGWEFMVLLKLVRDRSVPGGHRDSLEDAVSYAALMGEARLREEPEDLGDEEEDDEEDY